MDFCMVITTITGRSEAETLAMKILEKRLGACVQLNEIDSYYIWKNELAMDFEVRLLIKTLEAKYKELEKFILSEHPYELPQIIKVPISGGSAEYLNWIDDTLK